MFEVNTISSYAKGINNAGTIVGSYVHPTSGQFVGFVYFPTIADSFGLHNFDMNTHVWTQIENDGTGAKPCGLLHCMLELIITHKTLCQ
ncbi:MAG: hypothetical protein IPH46_09535 [Bacteroidetes bacterium]|nr:hypothetical protein [Bacteroidota bacterium]